MPWTLTHDGITKSLEAWGIESTTERSLNQQQGEITAFIRGDMLATVPWVHEDSVIIRKDDTVWFRGTVLPAARSGDGDSESVGLRFADPWYWLTQGEFTQLIWDANTAAAVASGQAALFAEITPGVEWGLTTIGAQISAIIAQCNTLHGGGKMQLGTLGGDGFDAFAPALQFNGGTFEDALRRCLDMVPDACTQWDHSTSPPTLNIYQRAEAPVRSFAFTDGSTKISQDITKRDDLVVRGARVIYITRVAGGKAVTIDQAGEASGAGVVTVQVDFTEGDGGGGGSPPAITGQPPIVEEQELVSESVEHTSAAWWAKYGGCGALAADISVGAGSKIELASGAPENAGVGSIGGKTRWLLKGQVPAWMDQSAHFCIAKVTGYLRIKVRAFEDAAEVGYHVEDRIVTMMLPCTDLSSNTYSNTVQAGYVASTTGSGEGLSQAFQIPPTGMAAAWLASLSAAPYEGSLVYTERECSVVANPGDVINITAGETAWATMKAQVQQVQRDFDLGTTTITFGPAKHLNLDDFARQASRMGIVPAVDIQRRVAGAEPGEGEVPDYAEKTVNHPAGSAMRGQTDGGVIVERWISKNGYLYHEKNDDEIIQKGTDPDDNDYELKPTGIKFTAPDGQTLEITPTAITFTNGDKTAVLNLNELVFTDVAKVATLDIGKLSLDDGAGKTTLLDLNQLALDDGTKQSTLTRGHLELKHSTATVVADTADGVTVTGTPGNAKLSSEELVITGSGKLGTYAADALSVTGAGGTEAAASAVDGLSHTDGTDTAELSAVRMQILKGADSVTVSPEDGLDAVNAGNHASIDAVAGVSLEIGGGTVTITPVAGKDVRLMATEGCSDEGDPVTALVLRSLEVAV